MANKLNIESWKNLITEVQQRVLVAQYLEDEEYNSLKDDLDFILTNINQCSKVPLNDYYTFLEARNAFNSVTGAHLKFKHIPAIVAAIRNIADEIKGNRKTPKKIKQEEDDKVQNAIKKVEEHNVELLSKIDLLKNELEDLKQSDYQKHLSSIKEASQEAKRNEKIIKDMVGVVAENANAGRYIKYANTAKYTANGLFLISIAIMIGVALIAIWPIWNGVLVKWIDLLPRTPVFFVVLLPAFFMMREAKKQRDKEFQFKDMECRILTAAQYIDSLEIQKKEKDKLKSELVKDFFSRPLDCIDDGGLPPIEQICDIVKTCLERNK